MPTYSIQGPDGQTYSIDGPEGATREQVIAQIKAKQAAQKRTDPVDAMLAQYPSPTEGMVPSSGMTSAARRYPSTIEQYLSRGLSGAVVDFPAGLLQRELDVEEVLGAPGAQKTSQDFRDAVAGARRYIEAGEEPEYGWLARGVGQTLPTLALPGGPAVAGGVAGAGQYYEEGDALSHLLGAGVGALTGGMMGGLLGLPQKFGPRALVAKDLRNYEAMLKERAANTDPALSGVRKNLRESFDRTRQEWEGQVDTIHREADRLGPLDMTPVEERVRTLADTSKMADSDTTSKGVLQRVPKILWPEAERPTALPYPLDDYKLTPKGNYVNEKTGHVYPADRLQIILDAVQTGTRESEAPNYSVVKGVIGDIDKRLRELKDTKGTAAQALRDVRDVLNERVDSLMPPSVKALEKRADQFHAKNISKYESDEGIMDIIRERDPTKRANMALEIGLGDNVTQAEKVADLVGAKGREAVTLGAVKRGLEEAWDSRAGRIDPVKLSNYFEKNKGLGAFMDRELDMQIKGMANLLTADAKLAGELPSPRSGPVAGWLTRGTGAVATLERLFHGDLPGAAMAASAGAMITPTYDFLSRMAQDNFGKHLLVAASKAPAGSPRMGRILTQAMQKFGASEVGGGTAEAVGP